ncbi:Hpt domain-containing protein [uncultured Polaribacter sp.]|uniref:Hpt domain-containing protein n=1 Tax=uncultured Polaribacter sp. TaxID=174711 RepID=UPI00262B737E|nr:Hpt domain-containing protein [uncultured Polaribacter sp.]
MEQPNLSVIKEIAGDDLDFQNSILEIMKAEFFEEVKLYKENFLKQNYLETSNDVHKLKHKISLLGLTKDFELAAELELSLKKNDYKLHQNFLEILNKIHVYLYD